MYTILLKYKFVGVNARDDERRTLLHVVCDCPQEEDTKDMVEMLIQR